MLGKGFCEFLPSACLKAGALYFDIIEKKERSEIFVKFIHTADWHLGKVVYGVHMTEDQRYILEQFIEVVKEEQPDAIVIAGDLYDRSVPPTEAVQLLDDTLYKINVELKIPIIAVSGNHDSAERLSFGSTWYRKSGLFIQTKVDHCFEPIRIKDVNFYCVPYAEPGIVRQAFQDEKIQSHQDAMRVMTERITAVMNPSEANVFVGHAFVLGGETSESERVLSVGGSGCVHSSLFEAFDYTALGHLHNRAAIKHPKIHYSGSLLKYSFSEVKHEKSISIVEMDETGQFHLRYRPLQPKHDMRELSGYIDELLGKSFYENEKVDDYFKIILLDEGAVLDPMNRLRQVYPNVLHLERKWDVLDLRKKESYRAVRDDRKTDLDLFETFYKEMTDRSFDEKKRETMISVIDAVQKEVGTK